MISASILLLLGIAACSDDDEVLIPPEDPQRDTATSADQALAQFQEFYAERNADFYLDLLSAEFQFADQDGGYTDLDGEIAVTNALFNEVEGSNNIVISDISITQLMPQGVWSATLPDDPHFGDVPESEYRAYLVHIRFVVAGQNLILQVQGPVIFYTVNVGTEARPDIRILGMVDQTYGNKATEAHTWSDVRGLFQ